MDNVGLPQGYASMVTARALPLDDEAWLPLMRDVLYLPAWMLPAVQLAIAKGSWRYAKDPLKSVRENSEREAIRMGLRKKPAVSDEICSHYCSHCGNHNIFPGFASMD